MGTQANSGLGGRVATPEEVAAVAVFLVSEPASYITGATIDVSGVILMH